MDKSDPRVEDYLAAFAVALSKQLRKDYDRWGNTWLDLPEKGQEERICDRFAEYYDDFDLGKAPFPWVRVAGNALIGWIRENYPELSENW